MLIITLKMMTAGESHPGDRLRGTQANMLPVIIALSRALSRIQLSVVGAFVVRLMQLPPGPGNGKVPGGDLNMISAQAQQFAAEKVNIETKM